MEYHFIGWCSDPSENHDKVWGAIKLKDYTYVTFWGRRGKKLQTKIVECSAWDMDRQCEKKRDKGYTSVNKDHLDRVYPEFENDLKQTAFWATLSV